MAIQEGPFQNIIAVNTDNLRYYVINYSDTSNTSSDISIYDTETRSVIRTRRLAYRPLKSSHSNNGAVAVCAEFSGGGYGIVIHDYNLDTINVINTPGEPIIFSGCSDGSFIYYDGLGVSKASISSESLVIDYSVYNYNVEIKDSDFTIPQGQDFNFSSSIVERDVAPLPGGGFCIIRTTKIFSGNSGPTQNSEGDSIFRGYVITYFSQYGIMVSQEVLYFSYLKSYPVIWDGYGNVRRRIRNGDLVLRGNGSIYSVDYILLRNSFISYAELNNVNGSLNYVDYYSFEGIAVVDVRTNQFLYDGDSRFFKQDFLTGDVIGEITDEPFRSRRFKNQFKYQRNISFMNTYASTGYSPSLLIYHTDKSSGSTSQYSVSVPGYLISLTPANGRTE